MLKKSQFSYSGMKIIEHNFNVPIDHFKSNSKTINIFAREISDYQKENSEDLPFLLFLQGGPGYESPRPLIKSGWLKRALMDYRVLLLDQRGTGLSSSISSQLFNGMSDESISKYLTHFRADNIIRDAEFIRKKLINDDRWNILGQSFGGFCAVTYLSYFPDSLDKVFITGGLPPIKSHPDDVYRSTYKRVLSKNKIFYETFPNSKEKVIKIVSHLERNKEYLPNGDILSVKRFQQLGLILGLSDGMATLNYLIENSFDSNNRLNYYFLKNIYSLQSFDTNPIFSVLHEACYAQGFATEWSAERIKKEFSEFEIYNNKFYFTGEMIYPWMFDFYSALRPLKGVSKIIANKKDWPLLYNIKNLENNNSKVVAVVYTNDMYVDREFSLDTASHISNISVWETEKYEHNGLRTDGEEILGMLFDKTEK